jgi:hypothetical protein
MGNYEAMPNTFAATTDTGELVQQLMKPERNPTEACAWADAFAGARFGR